MIRAYLGIAVFLCGLILLVINEKGQEKDVVAIGFAIMLIGAGVSLVPDKDARNL